MAEIKLNVLVVVFFMIEKIVRGNVTVKVKRVTIVIDRNSYQVFETNCLINGITAGIMASLLYSIKK